MRRMGGWTDPYSTTEERGHCPRTGIRVRDGGTESEQTGVSTVAAAAVVVAGFDDVVLAAVAD